MTAPARSAVHAPLPQTEFAVPGMRCAGCIAKLEGQLPLQPGIVAARVNLTAKRVMVSHLATLTPPDIVAALARLGFEAQPLDLQSDPDGDSESRILLKAMAVAGFAMMNIMLLSVSVWSGASGSTRDLFHWLSALIALPTIVYSGRPFFRSAWMALRHGRTNMDVPISIGVILATALSLYETATRSPHAYFDGAVMLLFVLLCGRWLDSVMRDRARNGVTALLNTMAPGALTLDEHGHSHWVAARALEPGMRMLVAAGERLAADGVIETGQTHLDLSLLTGESEPYGARMGTLVHAGTLNLAAPITVRITAAGQATAIADIARLMEQAGQARSRYVRIADRAARLYAPAVHTLAAASFLGWMLADAGWHHSLVIAVSVLIVTCPCALGLAVPAAQIVVAGALMRRGLLVKDGSALERLAEVDLALFDKTGTLTLGRPVPVDLAGLAPEDRPVVLALARASRHPLSEALRRVLEADGIVAARVDMIAEVPGKGMAGVWNGQRVTLERPTKTTRTDRLACVFSVEDGRSVSLEFADQLRPETQQALAALRAMGIDSSILSGDRTDAVAPVARALGLLAQGAASPQDKLAAIDRLTARGRHVLMVGDGLNDGPALAAGHASIAPSSASDAGRNAADLVFLGESLSPVPVAVRAARRTRQVVRQNFALAIGYNVLAVPLALAGLVTPLIAAIAMSTSSLIVVGNALRLRGAAR